MIRLLAASARRRATRTRVVRDFRTNEFPAIDEKERDAVVGSLIKDAHTLRSLANEAGQDNNLWVESVYQVGDNLVSATKVLITGIGKSGYVARRMAASMSSVGIASQYVHGTEWFHGDLGSLGENDAVVAFSHSGNTKELCDLFGYLRSDSFAPSRVPFLAAIVGTQKCTLSNIADVALVAPAEGELLGAVPSRSIVSQEAAVNAILSAVVQRTGFDSSGFGRNHPGGSIGESLRREEGH